MIAAEERALPVSFLAAGVCLSSDAQISGNSHQGYRLSTPVLHQGFVPVISNTATGFGALGYDFRVGPCYTGKERDSETGLDYFGARYFSGAQGRFTSPDIPFFDQDEYDPQSWNLYAYGRNNPLLYSDPTGHAACRSGNSSGNGAGCGIDVTVYSPGQNLAGAAKSVYNLFARLFNKINSAPSSAEGMQSPTEAVSYDGLFDRSHPAQLPLATLNNEGQRKGAMLATVLPLVLVPEGRAITIVEEAGGAIQIEVKTAQGAYEVVANVQREGGKIILDGAHVQGTGAGQFGPGLLRELREAARQFGKEQGVSEVVVNPGVRTSGANPGRAMGSFTVKVN